MPHNVTTHECTHGLRTLNEGIHCGWQQDYIHPDLIIPDVVNQLMNLMIG